VFSAVPILTTPAVISLVSISCPPSESFAARNDAIALCVGITLFESSENVGSVENSLTTTPDPPTLIPPSDNSLNPSRSKYSALIVTIPVACSTLNSSPVLKLPS